MNYTSTRSVCNIHSAEAITRGIADDGGLFVPNAFPTLDMAELQELSKLDYLGRAQAVLKKFLTDYSAEELEKCVKGAYTGTFDEDNPAPLAEVYSGTHFLELWHGPTCAFKDMALQLLPYLLTTAVKKTAPDREIVILVATSGDTGKAALAGFADVPGTRIAVFFPQDGVSAMQKRQMVTQQGKNVAVCGIEGNFDDAQTAVKQLFTDESMKHYLAERNMEFSSANSINFGRLVPQVIYYVSAACDLLKAGQLGDGFNVAVPTGNFGDILAAYYAKAMGVPIKKLICASNKNKVLTDFLQSGIYNRNREFYTTSSPSMDILISSNLERLLFHASNGDHALVAKLMNELKTTGKYQIAPELLAKLQQDFYGGFCDEADTLETIRHLFQKYHYLCDTHTAVAVSVLEQYRQATGDTTTTVVAATASPYKFAPAVLNAIAPAAQGLDDFALLQKLSDVSQTPIPRPLAALHGKEVLHKNCIAKEAMGDFVRKILK